VNLISNTHDSPERLESENQAKAWTSVRTYYRSLGRFIMETFQKTSNLTISIATLVRRDDISREASAGKSKNWIARLQYTVVKSLIKRHQSLQHWL